MDSIYKYSYCHRYRPGKGEIVGMIGKDGHPIDTKEKLEIRTSKPHGSGWSMDWAPPDNKANWENRKHLATKIGWTENNVKYKFDQYGWRQDPGNPHELVENNNALVVIGCSLTFGTGLNYNQTWPYYVAKELGLDCINLGQPGTGINASYRAAKMWVPIIKPKAVMWYVPDPHRREIWPHPIIPGEEEYADSVKSIGPWMSGKGIQRPYREYFELSMGKRETDIWREAYLDATKWLCRDSIFIHFPVTIQTAVRSTETDLINDNIIGDEIHRQADEHDGKKIKQRKYEMSDFTPDNRTNEARWARDMVHPGPKIHKNNIAPMFIEAYNES